MADKVIELSTMDVVLAVFGNQDANARLIEREFSVSLVFRGTEIKVMGEASAVQTADKAVCAMVHLHNSRLPLDEQAVRYCILLAREGDEEKVSELTGDFLLITDKGRPIRPKTLGQKAYINAIAKYPITLGVGPAGTGKTYLAVAMAVRAYKAHELTRIILTRPAVEAGEKLGFLPGDLQNKVDPYLRPLYDSLFDMLGGESTQRLLEKQVIEVAPLAYMRGRTLDDAFIILDEAQNTSREQMKMFLTRMGVGSRVVVTGDVTQIDLPDKSKSGLVDALLVLKNVEGVAKVPFSEKDVVRHKLVRDIIAAYDKTARARVGKPGGRKPAVNNR
jgi:phosphate starvation-inducible PhoH-like protein